jgi:hypothetical protein
LEKMKMGNAEISFRFYVISESCEEKTLNFSLQTSKPNFVFL